MDAKRILLVAGIILALAALVYVLLPKPCDYTNFAWGATKDECTCIGVKFDSSCEICDEDGCAPCPDAGSSTTCSGLVFARACYVGDVQNDTYAWTRRAC